MYLIQLKNAMAQLRIEAFNYVDVVDRLDKIGITVSNCTNYQLIDVVNNRCNEANVTSYFKPKINQLLTDLVLTYHGDITKEMINNL